MSEVAEVGLKESTELAAKRGFLKSGGEALMRGLIRGTCA